MYIHTPVRRHRFILVSEGPCTVHPDIRDNVGQGEVFLISEYLLNIRGPILEVVVYWDFEDHNIIIKDV